MKQTFSYGAATIQGEWPVHEDGFYVDPVSGTFILADGFGGRGGGDMAVKMILQDAKSKDWLDKNPSLDIQKKFIEASSEKILNWNAKKESGPKGGCSVIIAQIDKAKNLSISNCGACSAALWRAGNLIPLLAPQANPREFAGMPLFPTEALGVKNKIHCESRSFPLMAGDLILMGSSGLQWDSADFIAQFSAKMAVRFPGENLAPMAQELAEIFGGIPGQSWNRSFLVFEAN